MNRDAMRAAFNAAVRAVDPERATAEAFELSESSISVGDHRMPRPIEAPVVIAIGKAAPAMVRGVERALGAVEGIAVSDHDEPCPVEVIVSDHPIPTSRSVEAGLRLLDVASSVDPDRLVVFCISGGGSALADVPVDGVSTDDLAVLNRLMIAGGLPIEDINEVRASVSRFKGGGLQQACAADPTITMIVSDVIGAGPAHVASGPTIGHGLGRRAADVVETWSLGERLPGSVGDAIERFEPRSPEARPSFVVVGSGAVAAEGARSALASDGIDATIISTDMTGDAGQAVAALLDGVDRASPRIAAGEVTVVVTGGGLGGRNQHAALLAARSISGTDVIFGAFGTDGRDGPTDAAGAIVDGGSTARMAAAGVDVERAIADFDSYAALDAAGDLVRTGPTGTNVADVWIAGRVSA